MEQCTLLIHSKISEEKLENLQISNEKLKISA